MNQYKYKTDTKNKVKRLGVANLATARFEE